MKTPVLNESSDGHDRVINVRELCYAYPGTNDDVLHDVTFSIEKGSVLGLLGPSGSGKTTTQNILIGLLDGYAGLVEVFNRSVRDHGSQYYEHIGVCFERPNVHANLTGRENLNFFRNLYSGKTKNPQDLLDQVGLTHAADVRVSQYSKGMKVRLDLCRALLNHPSLLFLDEPTSGQDPSNARRIKDIIREWIDVGTTVFLTTHDMNVAADLCDEVAFLVDGRIEALDTPRNFMIRHGQRRIVVEYQTDDGVEHSEFDLDGLGQSESFACLLQRYSIERVQTMDATLEDVFIEVTGRRLA